MNAQLAELSGDDACDGGLAEQRILGDLQQQPVLAEAMPQEGSGDPPRKVRIVHQLGRDVHPHLQVAATQQRRPFGQLRTRPLEHQVGQRG